MTSINTPSFGASFVKNENLTKLINQYASNKTSPKVAKEFAEVKQDDVLEITKLNNYRKDFDEHLDITVKNHKTGVESVIELTESYVTENLFEKFLNRLILSAKSNNGFFMSDEKEYILNTLCNKKS